MVDLIKMPGQAVIGKSLSDVFDMFPNPNKEGTGGSPHVLEMAGTFYNVRDMCASTCNQLVDAVFLVVIA